MVVVWLLMIGCGLATKLDRIKVCCLIVSKLTLLSSNGSIPNWLWEILNQNGFNQHKPSPNRELRSQPPAFYTDRSMDSESVSHARPRWKVGLARGGWRGSQEKKNTTVMVIFPRATWRCVTRLINKNANRVSWSMYSLYTGRRLCSGHTAGCTVYRLYTWRGF